MVHVPVNVCAFSGPLPALTVKVGHAVSEVFRCLELLIEGLSSPLLAAEKDPSNGSPSKSALEKYTPELASMDTNFVKSIYRQIGYLSSGVVNNGCSEAAIVFA